MLYLRLQLIFFLPGIGTGCLDLMSLAPLLIRKSTQAALLNQRKPLLICTIFSFCHRCCLLLMLFGVDTAQAPNDLK